MSENRVEVRCMNSCEDAFVYGLLDLAELFLLPIIGVKEPSANLT